MKGNTERFPLHTWKKLLKGYYNFDYVINGITNGFRIGIVDDEIDDEDISDRPCYIPLSISEKQAITKWLEKGVDKQFCCGPYDLDYKFPFQLKCAPIFVVPKPNPGEYRPIVHLSWHGKLYSINDLINEHMSTVQYIKLKEVVKLMQSAGKGGYIFIIDMQDAYYRVPIHPNDYQYNGLKWLGKYWVFTSLQMGLSSSCKIYTEFADAIEWIVVNRNNPEAFRSGIQALRHYLDDFFAACRTKEDAYKLYNDLIYILKQLGIPTREDKCFPPNFIQKILGYTYNTLTQTISLPYNKRVEYLSEVNKIINKKLSDKKSLEQLRGRLGNVAQIRFPGKAFLRKFDALIHMPELHYNEPITLSNFVIEDLTWWKWILTNPKNLEIPFELILKNPDDADFKIYTDAASTLGLGGHMGNQSFQIDWKNTKLDLVKTIRGKTSNDEWTTDITCLELLGPVVACELWAKQLSGKSVTIYNDNPGAAATLVTKAPKLYRLDLNFLIIYLSKLSVKYNFKFWGVHLYDENMNTADKLSRLKIKNGPNMIDCSSQALNICNNILDELCMIPNNLPNQRDIPYKIRKEYKILLDDKYLRKEKINKLNVLEMNEYNVLHANDNLVNKLK